jgi:hypothetical protein
MNKLEVIAKRIAEISDEIKELKLDREINLSTCGASIDEEFESMKTLIDSGAGWELKENCINVAYKMIAEDRDINGFCGCEYSGFYEVLHMYGCRNCVAAYDAKKKIGALKQERGRLVGQITRIGGKL